MAATSSTTSCGGGDESEAKLEFLPGYNDVGNFSQDALKTVLVATRQANELPRSGDEFDYYSSFGGFRRVMQGEGKKILRLMSTVMRYHDIKGNLDSLDNEEMFDFLGDTNDTLIERIGTCIDEAQGKRKTENDKLVLARITARGDVSASWNRKKFNMPSSDFRLLAARNILRPQLKFKEKVDNTLELFVPIIKEKPNAIKPLAIVLEPTVNGICFSHPYQCELDHFQLTAEQLKPATVQTPADLETTPLIFINTPIEVEALVADLMNEKEIAIDLEHHSYRSFQGITCLMQLSTRKCDYIIDTLELRSNLQLLNEVFTYPKIVKVLHGAESDIEWLQRDLGVYVVNMFDTGQAARVLNMASCSLAYVLKYYFQITADKRFQLADWRIRPLPDEMVKYAREDTHYLLHVYDRMKNELLDVGNEQENLLRSVLQRSKTLCEKRYVKPVFNDERHLDLYRKSRKVFNSRQMYALKELYAWRDKIGRQEDESTGYILPNHMLLQISDVLPREQQGILACCNPIPPLVRQNLNTLHQIILAAREQRLVKTAVRQRQVVQMGQKEVDLDHPLTSPHDLSHGVQSSTSHLHGGGDSDVQMKLHSSVFPREDSQCVGIKQKPSVDIYEQTIDTKSSKIVRKKVKKVLQTYSSPYERYTAWLTLEASKPLVESEEVAAEEGAPPPEDVVPQQDMEALEDSHVPLRQQLPSSTKKKRKKKILDEEDFTQMSECPAGEGDMPQRKKKKLNDDNQETEFQPFDYSSVNFKEFQGGGGRNVGKKGRQNTKKIFDDDDDDSSSKRKHPKKRREQHYGSSYTYTQNRRDKPGPSKWPRR